MKVMGVMLRWCLISRQISDARGIYRGGAFIKIVYHVSHTASSFYTTVNFILILITSFSLKSVTFKVKQETF